MGRLTFFLAGLLVGAMAMFTALKYHVVRAEDGVHLVPKMTSDFRDMYVDVREFDAADWNRHRELAVALVKADKAHVLQEAAMGGLRETVDSVLKNLQSPPTSIGPSR